MKKGAQITRVVMAGVGIVGGILSLAAIPLTGGASVDLGIAGVYVAAASGAVGYAADCTRVISTQRSEKELQILIEADRAISTQFNNEITSFGPRLDYIKCSISPELLQKVQNPAIFTHFLTLLEYNTDVHTMASFAKVRLRVTAFNSIKAAIGILVNLGTMVYEIYNMKKSSTKKSQIETMVDQLEKELDEMQEVYDSLD